MTLFKSYFRTFIWYREIKVLNKSPICFSSTHLANSNYSQHFDPRFGSFSETLHRFIGRNTQQYQYHDIASRPHQSKSCYIQIRDNINNGLTSKRTLLKLSISNNLHVMRVTNKITIRTS